MLQSVFATFHVLKVLQYNSKTLSKLLFEVFELNLNTNDK